MTKRTFDELVALMHRLRAPGGCPWDREQTMETLRAYVVEESYEVVEAINSGDRMALREELGDFLLQAVFLSEIAEEEGSFDIYDAIGAIHHKLVSRHPHVFADFKADTADEVLANWEKLRRALDQTRFLQPVDNPAERDRLDIEQVGKLDLAQARLAFHAEQHLPLRTGHSQPNRHAIEGLAQRVRRLADFERKSFHLRWI